MTQPVPDGFHTLSPHITVKGAAQAIDFYKQAFGAEEISRLDMGPIIGHAELAIGDSRLMLNDEFPQQGKLAPPAQGSGVTLHLYVADADATYASALAAGATSLMAPEDMFWGDRYCQVNDPFGHCWGIATHREDVSQEECTRRLQAMMEQHRAGG
ncbi:MAG: VOC family protein [Planctomycetota bacterium]